MKKISSANTILRVGVVLPLVTMLLSSMALAATTKKEPVPSQLRNPKAAVPAKSLNASPSTSLSGSGATASGSEASRASAPLAARDDFFAGIGRTFSISAVFPGGGSQPIGNALGGRMKLDADNWIGGSVVFNNNTDNGKDKSLFGISGKFQHFVGAEKRARPYGTAAMYVWKPGGDANDGADGTAFGLSGAIGAEVWFVPEFSAFVETGLFVDKSNIKDTETELGTFTSAIGLNFNFDM